MEGFINVHRRLVEWEWYQDQNVKGLFIHLLLMGNYKDKRHKGMFLKAGTVITGRDVLAKELGLSVQQVRTGLKKLEKSGDVTIKTTSKGTVIQVVNYKKYQSVTNKQPASNQQVTNEQPTSNQQVTTNNKGNKGNKGNNIGTHPKLDIYGKVIS